MPTDMKDLASKIEEHIKKRKQAEAFASVAKLIGAIIVSVILFLVSMVELAWAGYVLTVLWGWFLAHYAAVPSVHVAAGAMLIVRYAFWNHFLTWTGAENKERTERLVIVHATAIFTPLGFLAAGYVWHWLQWGM